jgi:Spy/CpxP family protein refolding chaperone
MSDNDSKETKPRGSRHGFWFGVFLGVLGGAIVAGGLVTAATVKASPLLAAAAFRGYRGGHFQDPEKARRHAEFATAWVLDRVDATDVQQEEAKRIVDRTIDDLIPLVTSHRQNREEIHAELTRPEIDPEALERIRRSQVELIEAASKELTEALVDLARTLEPEQRLKLAEMAEEFHR